VAVILRANQRQRKHFHKSESRYRYRDIARIHGSVIPRIILPTIIVTLWSALWTILYLVANVTNFAIPTHLITILGVVMGLLLVFRTNTAYDRFWEGRRIWGTLLTHVRNLARVVWISVTPKNEQQANERRGCMQLLLAFTVATKHYLRGEEGHRYEDLHHLVAHLPDFQPGSKNPKVKNLPLEISFHIASYVARCRSLDLIDAAQQTVMTNALSGMMDCLTNFERIRNSPIPIAYSVHLKQTLMLYLLSLPFQLVQTMKWGTIPVVFLAGFTLLGIESIGGEIENPFGYDDNDLPVEEFCDDTRDEINRIMDREKHWDPTTWTQVYSSNAEPVTVMSEKPSEITINVPEFRMRK
ncbi:hypothetical protein HK104_002291, partial [Borealophlyctis nickersoniae]